MILIGICDDEPGAASMIASSFQNVLHSRGFDSTTREFHSAGQLLFEMEDTHFDLLLLDIDMPEMNGLELGRKLREDPKAADTELIYVSGREDKVFDSLKLGPIAFIRKSHFLEDIPTAVDLYAKKLDKPRNVLTIQEGQTFTAIPLEDILYIEGEHNYQIVHFYPQEKTKSNETERVPSQMRIRKSMKELETTLASYDFVRIHKGYLVNCAYIARIDDDVVLTNGEHLMLSRRNAEEVRLAYMNYIEKNAGPLI